jgi:hypothetical protein
LTPGAFPLRVMSFWVLFWILVIGVTPCCNFLSSQTLRDQDGSQTVKIEPPGDRKQE